MKKRAFILIVFVVGLSVVAARPAGASYTYYRSIEVTSTGAVASGTETNFPMLVSSTLSTFASAANGGHFQNANGYDHAYGTSLDCSSPLNYEEENYVSSTGALVDWVEVPSLSAGTTIYMCYGDPTISTSQAHPSGTWNSNYLGVWHFGNGTTLNASDSTSNANNGTVSGVTATSGEIYGGAANSVSTNHIAIAGPALGSNATATISAWINPNGTHIASSEAIISDNGGTNDLQIVNDELNLLSGKTPGSTTTYSGTGDQVNNIAFDGTNMWTANFSSSSVTKISPTGTMTTYTTSTLDAPYGIAFDGTNMWVSNYLGGSVTKVSPTGTMATYTGLGAGPQNIAFDGTNMWVATFDGNVVDKISPTGSVTSYPLPGNLQGIAFDGTNMWVTNSGSSSVTKISPTGATTTYLLGPTAGPDAIAFDGTNMWTANNGSSTVTKISPTGATTTFKISQVPYDIAFDGTNMWVGDGGAAVVTKISPTGATTTYAVSASFQTVAVAFDGTNMWTGNYVGTSVIKIYTGTFASSSIPTSTWTYVAGTIDASGNDNLYVNGVSAKSCVNTIPPLSVCDNTTNPLSGTLVDILNNGLSTAAFFGSLDEVRVANTVESPSWILTEYNNQASPSTFYNIGSESTYNVSISNIATSTNALTGTVSWTTSPAADTLVQYGTSSIYTASSTYDATQVTSHSVTLSPLLASTTYHFQIVSSDGVNVATSSDMMFTTLPYATLSGSVSTDFFVRGAQGTIFGNSNSTDFGLISNAQVTALNIISSADFVIVPGIIAVTQQATAPDYTMIHYHWRDDNGTEASATSATGGIEDTPLTGLNTGTSIRLRIEVTNDGGTVFSYVPQSFQLQYGVMTSTCSAISAWTTVASSGVWGMFNSANLNDGSDTTNIATSTGGVIDANHAFLTPNGAVKDATSTVGPLSVDSESFVEMEYDIQAFSSSTPGATYCFRVTNVGSTSNFTYASYPEATLSNSVQSITLTLNSSTVGLPSLSPGFPVTATTTATVNVAGATDGYSLFINRTSATSTIASGTITFPDYASWGPSGTTCASGQGNGTTTPGQTLSFRVESSTTSANYCSFWWGANDTNGTAIFAGIPTSTQTIVNTTSSASQNGTTTAMIEYRADAPLSQKATGYTGSVTITAIANP